MRHQYTVRGISAQLDARLREEAHASGKSLNAVVVETLEETKLPPRADETDLDWFIGDPAEDVPGASEPDIDEALAWLDDLPARV